MDVDSHAWADMEPAAQHRCRGPFATEIAVHYQVGGESGRIRLNGDRRILHTGSPSCLVHAPPHSKEIRYNYTHEVDTGTMMWDNRQFSRRRRIALIQRQEQATAG